MNAQLSREDVVRAARAAATSQKQMAELIGISHGRAVSYWINKLGLPKFGVHRKNSHEEIETIKAAFAAGETVGAIAEKHNITRNKVAGIINRAGMFKKRDRVLNPRIRKGRFKLPFLVEPKFRKEKLKARVAAVTPLHVAFIDMRRDESGYRDFGLQRGDCRQAYGDDPRTMTFCGHPVARGSYCTHHAEINYRKPDERNRNPRPRT